MDLSAQAKILLHQLQSGKNIDMPELEHFLSAVSQSAEPSDEIAPYGDAFKYSSLFQFILNQRACVVDVNKNARSNFPAVTGTQEVCVALDCSVVKSGNKKVCKNCMIHNIKSALQSENFDLLPLKENFFISQSNGKSLLYNLYSTFFTSNGQKYSIITLEDASVENNRRELQEQNNRMVFETERLANFGRWEFDFRKNIFKLSLECLSIFELKNRFVSLEEFYSLIHFDDLFSVKKSMGRDFKNCTGKPIEFRIVSPNNRVKHVVVRGEMFYDPKDGERRYLGYIQDISHYKKTMRILSARERKLRHISEISSDYTYSILLKSGYHFEWISGAFADITEYTVKEISNMPLRWMSVVDPQDLDYVVENLKTTSYNGASVCIEYRIITKSGKIKWIRDAFKFVCEEINGGENRLIGSVRDITHRKNVELDLVKAKEAAEKSDRLKTAFLNNLSHEVRTPLNSIIGFARFMRDRDVDAQKQKLYANALIDSSNRLLKIILDIVYVSKLETGFVKTRTEKVKLHQLLFNLISLHKDEAAQKGLVFEYPKFDNQEVYFQSDSSKLMQVLENLVQNAIKFTSQGYVQVSYKIVKDYLYISVFDTGIGIKQEDFDIIFERFTQVDSGLARKYGGNGLGLSISLSIARLLGGDIKVHSDYGKGSCFTLQLPFIPVGEEAY